MPLALTSPDFSDQADIPAKYTCQGDNVNPTLRIEDASDKAKSLALIMDDPDAATDPDGPGKTFDHWVVFNIDPATAVIDENSVPTEAIQGANGAGENKYTGPCPPNGKHRYFFKLYSLDTMLDLPAGSTKEQVQVAIKGHVLEQAQLVGLYQKT